jgi:hypothetical protein
VKKLKTILLLLSAAVISVLVAGCYQPSNISPATTTTQGGDPLSYTSTGSMVDNMDYPLTSALVFAVVVPQSFSIPSDGTVIGTMTVGSITCNLVASSTIDQGDIVVDANSKILKFYTAQAVTWDDGTSASLQGTIGNAGYVAETYTLYWYGGDSVLHASDVRMTTITVELEIIPPSSTVDIDNTIYGPKTWIGTTIKGTATDEGGSLLNRVEISIKRNDGKYWDGISFTSTTSTWITAESTTNWTYTLSAGNLTDGAYTVESRAIDNAWNIQTTYASDSFIYDATAPVITAVQSTPNSNSATITWNTTNESSTSKVYYWKDGLLTLEATGTSGTAHSVILTSLDPSTTYYFNVESADPAQNIATLEGLPFTTLAIPIQTYTISGYVSAPQYTEPIMVYLSGDSSACQPVQGPSGSYSFGDLLAGDYTVTVEAIKGYTLQAPTVYSLVISENISDQNFVFVKNAVPTGIEVPILPGETRNHPNPFNPSIEKTKIIFNIEEPEVKLTIYDLRGKALATKFATSTTNYYEVDWDGKSDFGGTVSNGTYLYLVTSGGKVLAKGQMAVWK